MVGFVDDIFDESSVGFSVGGTMGRLHDGLVVGATIGTLVEDNVEGTVLGPNNGASVLRHNAQLFLQSLFMKLICAH